VFFVLFVFIQTQNEDKQNKEHNTENLKDYQYRSQKKQNTERRQTKQRTEYRKPKRLPVQIPEKTKHRMKTNKTKNTIQKT
jgi:hypothetical protein